MPKKDIPKRKALLVDAIKRLKITANCIDVDVASLENEIIRIDNKIETERLSRDAKIKELKDKRESCVDAIDALRKDTDMVIQFIDDASFFE